jgi:methylphosphotriester-DNA--protein-cysteine methyltransferase
MAPPLEFQEAPPLESEEPDFSPHGWSIDQEQARVTEASHTIEVFDFHESFRPLTRRRLTKSQQRELAVRQAALRIASGLEARSLRALAKEIGCSHTTIDKALLVLCDRIGMRKFHVPDSSRQKMKEARLRSLASQAAET